MQQLNLLSELFVIGGIVSAIVIAVDLRACPQQMRIMNSVWVLTGLWASVFGLWAYFAFGRSRHWTLDKSSPESNKTPQNDSSSMPGMTMEGMQMDGMNNMGSMKMKDMPDMKMADMEMSGMEMPMRPKWQSATLSTLHCGAGCTLADLIGEWLLFFFPIAIGGSLLAGSWVTDYLLALLIGIGFQYAAIRGMDRLLSRGEAVRRAAKADILSLTAWQVGMYGWMAVVIFVFNSGIQPPRDTFYFWFMMQIAMGCGFLVALPVNVLLIRLGIKRGM